LRRCRQLQELLLDRRRRKRITIHQVDQGAGIEKAITNRAAR
jgi:hypothetical protein